MKKHFVAFLLVTLIFSSFSNSTTNIEKNNTLIFSLSLTAALAVSSGIGIAIYEIFSSNQEAFNRKQEAFEEKISLLKDTMEDKNNEIEQLNLLINTTRKEYNESEYRDSRSIAKLENELFGKERTINKLDQTILKKDNIIDKLNTIIYRTKLREEGLEHDSAIAIAQIKKTHDNKITHGNFENVSEEFLKKATRKQVNDQFPAVNQLISALNIARENEINFNP